MSAQSLLLDNTGMDITTTSTTTKNERLLADIGGTNARFALLSPEGDVHKQIVLPCANHDDIVSAIKEYLSEIGNPPIQEAAMAIANPITGDRIKMTNHHWAFSIAATRDALGLKALTFKNDFTALAMSVPLLPATDLKQVGGNAAQQKGSALAVLGPGTGLGVSGLIRAGEQWIPLEGEGGHVSAPPANERECDILKTCWKHYDHVSAERLISGMGLQNLYQAICKLEGADADDLSPAEISNRGKRNTDPHCAEALAVFCGLLGSVAGNLVLTLGAFGGVYIGGGIVPRLGDYFETSPFRERFEAKGRFRGHLEQVPAYVIHAKHPALLGIGQAFS